MPTPRMHWLERLHGWVRSLGERFTKRPPGIGSQALAELPESIRDQVTTMRTATRWKQRADAANQFMNNPEPAATPHLIATLDDPHPQVRVAAARALIWMKPEHSSLATPRLIRMLREEKRTENRDIAATALGTTGNSQAAPALIEALSDRNAMVRHQAIQALIRLKHDAAAPDVHALLKDKDVTVRKSAADFLGMARYGPAHDDLRRRLDSDPDHYVQRAAARALGHLQSEQDVDLLLRAMKKKHVTDEAAKALEKIGEKLLEGNPRPGLDTPLVFAIKHVKPGQHPRAFQAFLEDAKDPEYAHMTSREWKLHAQHLKSDETALKAA